MSGTNNSGSNTNQMAVPQAKEAMNRFKQEVASEIGVPLKEGYNGDLHLHRQEASAARWSINDHEAGAADVRQINLPQISLPQIALPKVSLYRELCSLIR